MELGPRARHFARPGRAAQVLGTLAGADRAELGPWAETALTNGLIAGRFTMESMFQSLSEFRNGAGMPICRGDSYYDSVKILVCNLRDISSEVPGPGAACDSISMGVGFTAQPAKLGAVGDNLAPSPGCPAETTPATDSCPD